MTTTATTIDLRPFCFQEPPDRFRAAGEPQTVGNLTYATDGRILMRVLATGPDTLRLPQGSKTYETDDGRAFPSAWSMPLPLPPEVADANLWQPWPAPDYVTGTECPRNVRLVLLRWPGGYEHTAYVEGDGAMDIRDRGVRLVRLKTVSEVSGFAQAVAETFWECAAKLWNEGKPSPRTCEWCKLGPCRLGVVRKDVS